MTRRNDRRDFLKQTTAAGLGFWVAGSTVSLADTKSANDKINFACIGTGGKGHGDTEQVGTLGNIVAICDIDESKGHLGWAIEKYPSAKVYYDYRKMFDEMAKDIDAVTVSTPDHHHAPASMMAMKLKKHVYCQKPLTHSVYEARMMRETAAKMGVATQMGNQGTAENGLRRAVEIVQAGVLGHVTEFHVWTNRPIWPQAPKVMARPSETQDVPSTVHWNEFLGPAPERPYNKAYHPFAWRGWWDFGTGALGDMACHTANMGFMALKLGHPTTIAAECGDLNPETCPSWASVVWEFPARGDMGPCKMFWYEGQRNGKKNLPPEELLSKLLKPGQKLKDSGSILVGTKGIIFSPDDYGASYTLVGDGLNEAAKAVPETLARNGKGDRGMKVEWVEMMRGGPKAFSSFDYSAMLDEVVVLGNVAIRAGKKLEWNGELMKATNCPAADQYIKREYRKGWTL